MLDLGLQLNADVMSRFLSLDGKRVLDIGCGALPFTRILAELGASAVGVDPDPIQAEKNRTAEPIPNVKFIESGADQLPFDDQSFDGVTFAYSLHQSRNVERNPWVVIPLKLIRFINALKTTSDCCLELPS